MIGVSNTYYMVWYGPLLVLHNVYTHTHTHTHTHTEEDRIADLPFLPNNGVAYSIPEEKKSKP